MTRKCAVITERAKAIETAFTGMAKSMAAPLAGAAIGLGGIASLDDAYAKHHLNPAKLRWELHRVWEVEATVVSGKRHAVPKRRYYFDEDTWLLAQVDGYDSEGKLWRTSMVPNFFVPAVPAVLAKVLESGDDAVKLFSALKTYGYGASPMPLPLLAMFCAICWSSRPV